MTGDRTRDDLPGPDGDRSSASGLPAEPRWVLCWYAVGPDTAYVTAEEDVQAATDTAYLALLPRGPIVVLEESRAEQFVEADEIKSAEHAGDARKIATPVGSFAHVDVIRAKLQAGGLICRDRGGDDAHVERAGRRADRAP